ncbi:MAG: dTDP-4-dehydrorhamnose 3,5-epimerase family protein [Akkermansiaceae bacterium]|nr:dTDP-4-dehydrorhamnose 3,5-epimerase family protein [Akkermansiaceae bacterium]
MIFHETKLAGAFIVELDRRIDERGFFARSFCAEEFRQHGIQFQPAQANISHSNRKGTLRGMHYQGPPVSETKFIRCIRGAVWDVIIDMRPDSPTYLQHIGVELSADNGLAIFVPDLFAHGNQALTDDAELLYLVGGPYTPGFERGVRYDEPLVQIEWPLPVTVIDQKDRAWPPISPTSPPI